MLFSSLSVLICAQSLLVTGTGDPSDFDFWPAEVDQQANGQTCGFEIVESLRHVNVIQGLDRLQLNHDTILNQKVSNIVANNHTIIVDRNAILLLYTRRAFRSS